jgi:hypothetical protein
MESKFDLTLSKLRSSIVLIGLLLGSVNLFAQTSSQSIKTVDFIQSDLIMPFDLALVDGWLFVYEHYSKNKIIAFDAGTGEKVLEFATEGRGPGEYISLLIQKGSGDNTLELVDTVNKKVDSYNVPCLKNMQNVRQSNRCIESTHIITASRQAIQITANLTLNHSASVNGFLNLSSSESILKSLSSIPNEILRKYNRPNHAAMTMTGRLTASSDRRYFAYFADSFDYALFFQRNGTDAAQVSERKHTFLPSFEVQEFGGGSAVFLPAGDYTYTFGSPDSGKNNYFVLYSGKQSSDVSQSEGAEWRAFTNRVHVYSRQGNKVKELMLDREVFNIAVNLDESMLYGIHFDSEMNPTIIKATL